MEVATINPESILETMRMNECGLPKTGLAGNEHSGDCEESPQIRYQNPLKSS
jgi:hypothetical protein